MTAELQRSESGTQSVRRIVRAQVGKALEALQGRKVTDKEVHSARKELKRARAALRLLRDALGDATYRKENATLRDIARPLSRIRDGKVLLETLDKLEQRFGATARNTHTQKLRQALRRERTSIRRALLDGGGGLASNVAALRKAHVRAGRWPVGAHGWKVVGAGFERVYAKGRKALARAEADRSVANLHEWRKQTKYLWHQLQTLEPLWPGPIGELADQAHKLADYLGDDHDLSVLRGKVLEKKELFPNPGERALLVTLIDRMRTELRDKAMVLGRRLYQEKPAAFAARFEQYWHDWHGRR